MGLSSWFERIYIGTHMFKSGMECVPAKMVACSANHIALSLEQVLSDGIVCEMCLMPLAGSQDVSGLFF